MGISWVSHRYLIGLPMVSHRILYGSSKVSHTIGVRDAYEKEMSNLWESYGNAVRGVLL